MIAGLVLQAALYTEFGIDIADSFFQHLKSQDLIAIIPIVEYNRGQEKPDYAVFSDSSMANDSVAANFEQIFVTYSPETVRKVL